MIKICMIDKYEFVFHFDKIYNATYIIYFNDVQNTSRATTCNLG